MLCVECGAVAPAAAKGWRVYLDDEDEPVVYCTTCAAREFDG
jgi:hypothetical protein